MALKQGLGKTLGFCLRVGASLVIALVLMAGISSLFHWVDPGFSLGVFEMLALRSPSAWLLLVLATVIVFVVLSRLGVFGAAAETDCSPDSRWSE